MSLLIIDKGEPYQKGHIVPLDKKDLTIGRASVNAVSDIMFANTFISNKHLLITFRDERFYVIDTNSKNGTKLNNAVIEKNNGYALKDGDNISLSEGRVLLVFREEEQQETMTAGPSVEAGGIVFDDERRELTINGKQIRLAGNPYTLFKLLYENRGRVVTHDDIRKTVWSYRAKDHNGIPLATEDEIMTTVMRLRRALQEYPDAIKTKRGFGYMLEKDDIPCRNYGR